MGRIYQPSGAKGWYIDMKAADGSRVRKRVAKDRRTAERILRELERQTDLERAGVATGATNQADAVALWEAFREHLVTVGRRRKTIVHYQGLIPGFLQIVGARTVKDITPASVDAYIQHQTGKGLSPRRINAGITAVQTMLRWAERAGKIGSNALRNVEKVAGHKVKSRRALEDAEVRGLLDVSPPHYRRIWQTLLLTGLRKNELVELCWKDVDLDGRRLTVRAENCKVKRTDVLPIGSELEDVFREIMPKDRDPEGYVFTNAAGRPWRNNLLARFKACVKAAGIDPEGVDLHALRYTYGTMLAADPRNDVRTVMSLMRHRTVQLTLGLYSQPRVMRQRAAVEGLNLADRGKAEAKRPERIAQLVGL